MSKLKKDSAGVPANAEKQASSGAHRFFTVLGVVLCIILIPMLAMNIALIVKSYTNRDEVPSIGGYLPLIVLTDSMYPEIQSGDLIFCRTVEGEDVKEGDIIAYFDPEGNGTSVVTHRVVGIIEENGAYSFRTKGDANNAEDSLAVPEEDLVGRYFRRIPGAGNVAMFFQTTTGLIVCVALPTLLLIIYDVMRRRQYERVRRDDTHALMAELERLRAEKEARTDKEIPGGPGGPSAPAESGE